MALVKKTTSSNRLIVIAIVIVVVGGAAWFLIQQFLFSGKGQPSDKLTQNRSVITNFGEDILSDPRYRDLKSFGQTPEVNVNAEAGNPNPFQ